jgi:hypothetical protein
MSFSYVGFHIMSTRQFWLAFILDWYCLEFEVRGIFFIVFAFRLSILLSIT